MSIKNFFNLDLSNFDKIIVLSKEKLELKDDKLIYLNTIVNEFCVRTYCDIPLLNFAQKYPKVRIVVTNFPVQPNTDKKFNETLLGITEFRGKFKTVTPENKFNSSFDKLGYSTEEIITMISDPQVTRGIDGEVHMKDNENPITKIKNDRRETAYQPEHYKNTIYFLGTCHQYGLNAPYDKTIESYLQKMLNEKNLPYRVENCAQTIIYRYQDIFYILNKLNPQPNDIILIYLSRMKSKTFRFCDVSRAFDSYDYREIYPYKGHINEIGYKLLAEKYFDYLTENNFFQDIEFNYPLPPPAPHRYGIPKENFSQNESIAEKIFDKKELEAYRKRLRERRPKIGCIVMNANPFTLGHEYLVEYASSRVNKLFVMVVSEDKSEFSFEDRFELVKRGTAKFPNVEVLQTEKFISSMQTFSGYFNKENLQDVEVDSTQNDEIFAQEVAPSLGITIRFDGTEPRDKVTRRQMETLDVILPKYGIEHCVIPRREVDGQVVSAKTVRAALNNKDLDTLKKLLPQTTYDYLVEKFLPKDEK